MSDEMVWVKTPTPYWCDRWVLVDQDSWSGGVRPSHLRIISDPEDKCWQVRWGGHSIKERLPITLSLEEAQAVAIALWRMR